jgi:hypothetical protein
LDQLIEGIHMREIEAAGAKTPLSDEGRRPEEIDQAIADIVELRKSIGKSTRAEILSARDEGRKY